jgi:hypothetical protein
MRALLDGWDYDANRILARWIEGEAGNRKVQLRVDLGILQMEPEGRPDGQRPHGYATLLAYYQYQEAYQAEYGRSFALDEAACAELQQEAMQYYYRYLAYYALRHLDGVLQDTRHNLELLELIGRCADDEEVIWQFMQYYPYVLMMNVRAKAETLLEADQVEDAMLLVEQGVADLCGYYDEFGEEDEAEESSEIEILEDLLEHIRQRRPKSQEEHLHEQLLWAIRKEDYEQAAELRDQLRDLASVRHCKPLPKRPSST